MPIGSLEGWQVDSNLQGVMSITPETYVINLARRTDRLRRISDQLATLEIPFTRIDAVDARVVRDEDIAPLFATDGKYGVIAKGDCCCTLSHIRCWQTIAKSSASHALVLEDDVVLHPDAGPLLSDLSWLPQDVQLLKIESYGPASQRILVGKQRRVATGTSIAPLHSKHTGSGAYIVTRTLAKWLLEEVRVWPMSIDQMLFNPHISPITEIIKPFQLIPAVAKQVDLKESSDIEEWRAPLRQPGLASLKRSLRRAHNDLSILPRQAFAVFVGRSHLIKI